MARMSRIANKKRRKMTTGIIQTGVEEEDFTPPSGSGVILMIGVVVFGFSGVGEVPVGGGSFSHNSPS